MENYGIALYFMDISDCLLGFIWLFANWSLYWSQNWLILC